MSNDVAYPDKTRFARGVALIFAKQPDAEVCAMHDELFYGSSEGFTDDERRELENLGWREREGSWAFFT